MGCTLSILEKLGDIVGGGLFKEAKELIKDYWPPDVSPEKRAEFDLKLAELEASKSQAIADNALKTLQAELGDVQNARITHAQSNMPAIITVMLTVVACALLYTIIFVEIKAGSQNIAYGLFGTTFTLWQGSVMYWIGTTRSSTIKNDIIAQSQPPKS